MWVGGVQMAVECRGGVGCSWLWSAVVEGVQLESVCAGGAAGSGVQRLFSRCF